MRKILIGGFLAMAIVGGVAVAQVAAPADAPERPHRGGGMFKAADANGDGMVTRAEMIAAATKHFDALDTNKDGKVTREEMMAARARHRAEMMARWGSGEPGQGWRHRGPGGPGGPGGFGPDGPGFGPGGPGGPGGMLGRLDSDHDGKVSQAEFDAPFVMMDTNKDGFVEADERQAAAEAMRARFEQMRAARGGKLDRAQAQLEPQAEDTGK